MIGALLLAMAMSTTDEASLTRHRADRPDGSAITYWLDDRDGRSSDVMLVMQGTGCEAVSTKPNLKHAAELLRPGGRTLLIDKVGVAEDTPSPIVDGCSQRYWDRYTLSQRVEDCLQVVADLRRQPWWTGRVYIFGGSEGGAVAALLAPLVPEARGVIVLSSGTGVPVGDLIRSVVPPAMAAQAPVVFAEARQQPSGARRWAGLSYRWWDDAVDTVPARSLARSRAPVLLIQGARDTSSPVATARSGFARLQAAKVDVQYREFATLDHFMREADGTSHMDEVLLDAGKWIATRAR